MIYTKSQIAALAAQAVLSGDHTSPLPPELEAEWAAALDRALRADELEGSEA